MAFSAEKLRHHVGKREVAERWDAIIASRPTLTSARSPLWLPERRGRRSRSGCRDSFLQKARSVSCLMVSVFMSTLREAEQIRLLGPQRHPAPGGFFSNAQDFTLHNPAMTSVQGDYATVTYQQGDRNIVPQSGLCRTPFLAMRAYTIYTQSWVFFHNISFVAPHTTLQLALRLRAAILTRVSN